MKQPWVSRLGLAVVAAVAAATVYATVGTAAGTASPPASNSAPQVSGDAVQGRTLTATSGSWTGVTPMTFAYQWQRCDASGAGCVAVAGATSQSYTVVAADVGKTLRVVVTASNADGSGSASSAPTAVVVAATAPVNAAAPQVSGTLKVGQTLTVTPGTWSGTAPISYTYEWQRCNAQGVNCASLSGATATTYTLVAADLGTRLQVLVTAKNDAGQARKYSNQTGQVGSNATPPANTATPQLTGTPRVGQTLRVTAGTWTGTTPIALSYQWQRCNAQGTGCAPIAGASGQTYVLTAADLGGRLQVLVSATNAGGTVGKYSNQTTAVAAAGSSTGSIAASAVVLPNRLVIDSVKYPTGGHARTPFTARFHVSDTANRSVSGALVYVVGLPYGWVRSTPEQATDASGWATIALDPTAKMPLRTALVMFVRARTPSGDLLAGASTRRLVQVRIRR